MKNLVAFLGCGVLALAIGCGDGGSAPVAPAAGLVKPGQPQMMTTPPADAGMEKKEEPAAETKEAAPAEKKEDAAAEKKEDAPAEKKEEAGEKKE